MVSQDQLRKAGVAIGRLVNVLDGLRVVKDTVDQILSDSEILTGVEQRLSKLETRIVQKQKESDALDEAIAKQRRDNDVEVVKMTTDFNVLQTDIQKRMKNLNSSLKELKDSYDSALATHKIEMKELGDAQREQERLLADLKRQVADVVELTMSKVR